MAAWQVYCDETCTAKPNRYPCVGGILLPLDNSKMIASRTHQWRADRGVRGELKWVKVSKGYYEVYEEFVSDLLEDVRQKRISLASISFDRRHVDIKARNSGCAEELYRKLYYQMILHKFVPQLGEGDTLNVFPDKSKGQVNPDDLRNALNNGICCRYGSARNRILTVMPVDSKSTQIGQANDVLLGAVGFHTNSKHEVLDASPAKVALAGYIAQSFGVRSLADATAAKATDFNRWRFRFHNPAH